MAALGIDEWAWEAFASQGFVQALTPTLLLRKYLMLLARHERHKLVSEQQQASIRRA